MSRSSNVSPTHNNEVDFSNNTSTISTIRKMSYSECDNSELKDKLIYNNNLKKPCIDEYHYVKPREIPEIKSIIDNRSISKTGIKNDKIFVYASKESNKPKTIYKSKEPVMFNNRGKKISLNEKREDLKDMSLTQMAKEIKNMGKPQIINTSPLPQFLVFSDSSDDDETDISPRSNIISPIEEEKPNPIENVINDLNTKLTIQVYFFIIIRIMNYLE